MKFKIEIKENPVYVGIIFYLQNKNDKNVNLVINYFRYNLFGIYYQQEKRIVKINKVYKYEIIFKVAYDGIIPYLKNLNKFYKNVKEIKYMLPYKIWSPIALKDELIRRGVRERDISHITDRNVLIELLSNMDIKNTKPAIIESGRDTMKKIAKEKKIKINKNDDQVDIREKISANNKLQLLKKLFAENTLRKKKLKLNKHLAIDNTAVKKILISKGIWNKDINMYVPDFDKYLLSTLSGEKLSKYKIFVNKIIKLCK